MMIRKILAVLAVAFSYICVLGFIIFMIKNHGGFTQPLWEGASLTSRGLYIWAAVATMFAAIVIFGAGIIGNFGSIGGFILAVILDILLSPLVLIYLTKVLIDYRGEDFDFD